MTTRRDFVWSMGVFGAMACGAAPATRVPFATNAAPRVLNGLGVQLYMLRNEMRRAPEATLQRIATIGYKEVEWWGTWRHSAAELRAMLDANGLTSPAAHVDASELAPDKVQATLERADVMGHRTLIVAWTPPATRTLDGWKRLAATLSDAGRRGASGGIGTGYHNHDFEFADLGGETAFEILMRESDAAAVTFEVDCYWAYKAGVNPVELIRRHADRVTHLHLKDAGPDPERAQRDVGAGVIDWRELLRVATSQRVRHAYVDHDEPADAWATASAGLAHLRALGY